MFYACSTGVVCFRFSTGTEILVLSLYCTCVVQYMFFFPCHTFLCVRMVYSTVLFYLIKICLFVNNFLFFPKFIETCFCCCTRVRYWYGRFSFFSQGQFFFTCDKDIYLFFHVPYIENSFCCCTRVRYSTVLVWYVFDFLLSKNEKISNFF